MSKLFLGGLVIVALLPVGAAAAGSSSPALPPSPTAPARHSFFTSDQDRADAAARIDKMFRKLDSDHDGFITRTEISSLQSQFDARAAKGLSKREARMFDRLDADHDGKITLAEATASRHARARASNPARHTTPSLFAHADANKDGIVTRAEFDAAVAGGKVKLRHAAMRGSQIVRMFDVADTDKDGRVSLDEARQAALAHFDAQDINRDGVLTPAERRQAAKANRTRKAAG